MISSILIRNFQSHKETVLDLHEGVNALVGLTGAGKSVVFKALDWLYRNRPLGDEYRSWWGGDTQVEVSLKEGPRIGRIRTDSDNYYYIDDQQFRAFGNGSPPQPVLDALNLSDVNFQAQADPSFLISNSSGEVARYLNRAAHLDVIDQALASIAGTLRREKEDLGRARADLEQAQAQMAQYEWLPEADGKLAGLERIQERFEEVTLQRLGLVAIISDYVIAKKELDGLVGILDCSREAYRLLGLNDEIEKQNEAWEGLAAIVDQHEKAGRELEGLIPLEGMGPEIGRLIGLSDEIRKGTERYALLEGVILSLEETEKALKSYAWLPKVEERVKGLAEMASEFEKMRENRSGLSSLIRSVDEASASLTQVERELEGLRKRMPEVCPLCEGTGRLR